MAVTPAYDVGGFGRLASMKIAKRAEGREERRLGIAEKSAAQNLRLGGLQIKQMEGNLQSIKYKGELTQDLQKVLANVPEGKNRYVAGQSYLMSMAIDDSNPAKAKIAYDLSQEARENQGNIIDDMAKLDEEGAITAYNESIGEFDRHKLTYHSTNKAGKIFEAVSNKTGESVFVQNTDKGLVELKGFKPPSEKGKEPTLKDKNLIVIDSLAKKIKDGTATPAEIQTYKLAESDYVEPKRIVDSVTGEVSLMQPTLPKGMPTFKEKEEGTEPQKSGHTEPLLSTGDFKIMPVSDPKRLSKSEISNYRTAANSLYLMRDMLTDLKDDIEKNGLRTLDVGLYADRNSNYWDILMRYKEVLNLGVLNGPDVEVMQNILKDPTAIKSIGLGKGWVIPGYENVIESLNRELNRMNEVTSGIVGKEGGDSNTAEDYMKKWSD